eukprot:919081-Heterocapsa_arctica.AAC.1
MAVIKKVVEVPVSVDFLGITSNNVMDWIPESTVSKHKDKVFGLSVDLQLEYRAQKTDAYKRDLVYFE